MTQNNSTTDSEEPSVSNGFEQVGPDPGEVEATSTGRNVASPGIIDGGLVKLIERESAASRPLPVVTVEFPSATRGIPDVRAHLDGSRCDLCGVPVAEDEQNIRVDVVGTMAHRPVCKGHLEHPETILHRSWEAVESYRRCPRCDRLVSRIPDYADGVCFACHIYQQDGEFLDSISLEARAAVGEAGDAIESKSPQDSE